MNERIKELREQALRWSGENINRNLYTDYEIQLKEYQKFAELIVKECMAQCDKVEHDDELSNHEGGFRDGALLCYQEIREHFGVEE